jgi:hypothetical protein
MKHDELILSQWEGIKIIIRPSSGGGKISNPKTKKQKTNNLLS